MRSALALLAGLPLLFLPACSADLPEGWGEATRVDGLTQADCSGNPYEGTHDERLEAAVSGGGIRTEYKEAHFRCEQQVEAWEKRSGSSVEVLVQPIDLTPNRVASCDCLYDIAFDLVDLSGETTVTLYRRWDEINEPNDPVRIGSQTLTVP